MGRLETMRIINCLLAAVSCCDIFQSDPNSVSVYDHISYFFDDCGQEAAAKSVKTILPISDLILPNGYYRSWWSSTLDGGFFLTLWGAMKNDFPVSDFTRDRVNGAISFLDMWVNRNGNWWDVTNWSLRDNFSLVSLENTWYQLLRFAFKFPPKFENIESGNFEYELKEFGFKDYQGESSGLRGFGYRFYADRFFPEFTDNDVINTIEQFLLLGWPVYALTVAILEGAWEQTAWHLLNLLTQYSEEILVGYYWTLRGLIEGLINQVETTIDLITGGSGTIWDKISNIAFSVNDVLSRAHEISRVFMSMSVDVDYQIRYAQNVFKYAEDFVSDIPVISEIYNAIMFLSDQVGETINYLLNIEIADYTFEDYLAAQYQFFFAIDQTLLQVTSLTYLALYPVRIADAVINPGDNAVIVRTADILNISLTGSGTTGNGTVV